MSKEINELKKKNRKINEIKVFSDITITIDTPLARLT